MKLRFLTKWIFGLTLLLLMAGHAHAQPFLYGTSVTPTTCTSASGNTSVNLITTGGQEFPASCGANGTDLVLMNMEVVSSASSPETVGPCNYSLTLTINGHPLNYTGMISGTASAGTANIVPTISPLTEQVIVDGCTRYRVTVTTIVPPSPPGGLRGAIGAHVVCETCTTTLTKGTINACYPSIEAAQQAALDATTATNNCNDFTVTKTASNDGNLCPVTIIVNANCATAPVTYQAKIITAQPTLNGCPDNATYQCLSEVPPPANVTATDSCGAALDVSFSETGNNGTNCNNTITRTWTATDCLGQMATCTQTITVNDTTAPVLSGCPTDNPTVQCLSGVPDAPTVTATDNCNGDVTVDFSETQSKPGSNCNNVITRTWTAKDSCGNTATCTQTITVNDTTAPVLSGCPTDNPTVQCVGDVPPAADVTATDNCDGTVQVQFSETQSEGAPCNYTITRTWTAMDSCGNTATCTQTITIHDTTAPTINNCPTQDISVNGSGSPCQASVPLNITASDNCDLNPTLTCQVTLPDGSVVSLDSLADPNNPGSYLFPQGTSTVTCTATDICNNMATPCTFKVTVNCPTGATRTQGFWATHLTALQMAVAKGCIPVNIDTCRTSTVGHLEAIFWGNIAKQGSTSRTPLGQARMQLGQQLVAAYANCCFLGSCSTDLAGALAAIQGTDVNLIKSYIGILDNFNSSGDSVALTPAQQQAIGSANPTGAKAAADKTSGVIDPGPCFK